LVDELHLMIGSVVLGGGTPAFGDELTPQLALLDTRTFDDSDNFVVRYVAAR
jgi:riboflavin biosynthesis pyrimidine reductase